MSAKKLVRFDWTMKYILRNKANFDVVEAFLSNFLKEEIKVLDILESESNEDAAASSELSYRPAQEVENRKFNCVDNEDIDEWVYFFKHGEIIMLLRGGKYVC